MPQADNATFHERLADIIDQIHAASSISEIILEITPRTLDLIDAERVTVFALDSRNNQLYSLFKDKTGGDVREVRVDRSPSSIAGFCAVSRSTVNIRDAYDDAELQALHPKLRLDKRWDEKTGFRTRHVLVTPLIHEKYLMGVLQVINKRSGDVFTDADQQAAQKIARTLGIAFYNQRKMLRTRKPNKYGYLLDSNLLTEQQLEEVLAYARMNNRPIAAVLIEKCEIPKEEVLRSLAQYYNTEYFLYDGSQQMPTEFKDRLNFDYLSKLKVAPLSRRDDKVLVAMEDPSDLSKVDLIRIMQLSRQYEHLVALPGDIERYLHDSYGIQREGDSQADDILVELSSEPRTSDTSGADDAVDESDSAIVRFANQLIRDGAQMGGLRHPRGTVRGRRTDSGPVPDRRRVSGVQRGSLGAATRAGLPPQDHVEPGHLREAQTAGREDPFPNRQRRPRAARGHHPHCDRRRGCRHAYPRGIEATHS